MNLNPEKVEMSSTLLFAGLLVAFFYFLNNIEADRPE